MGGGGLSFLNKKTWHPARLDRQVPASCMQCRLTSNSCPVPQTIVTLRFHHLEPSQEGQ